MCYNCVIIELSIKSYLIQIKVEPFLYNYVFNKYTKKCFNNNKNRIMNFILYKLDINSKIKQNINLYKMIDNIIDNPYNKRITCNSY